jgi:hypothetical protein
VRCAPKLNPLCVALLLACAACSSRPAGNFVAEDFSQSGSRLRLHWFVAGEERTQQLQYTGFTVEPDQAQTLFFDTALGLECMAKRWDDGAMYCTPGPYALPVYYEPVYRDAACTQPAIIVQQQPGACLTGPLFAKIETFETVSMFATLGAATTDTQYYRLVEYTAESVCMPEALRSDATLYEAAHVFDRSELVPLTLGAPRGETGRLKWQYLESPDGLVAPGVIFDEELGKPCGFGESGTDGKMTCRYRREPSDPTNDIRQAIVTPKPTGTARLSLTVMESGETSLPLGGVFYDTEVDHIVRPIAAADGTFRTGTRYHQSSVMFEDSACSVPIDIVVHNTDYELPTHVVKVSCNVIEHVHDLGAKTLRPYVRGVTPMSCTPYSLYASDGITKLPLEFYRVGAEQPFDALGPAISVETD